MLPRYYLWTRGYSDIFFLTWKKRRKRNFREEKLIWKRTRNTNCQKCIVYVTIKMKLILTWHHLGISQGLYGSLLDALPGFYKFEGGKKQWGITKDDHDKAERTKRWSGITKDDQELPALCFLPLFHGVFPLFARPIFLLLRISLLSFLALSFVEQESRPALLCNPQSKSCKRW